MGRALSARFLVSGLGSGGRKGFRRCSEILSFQATLLSVSKEKGLVILGPRSTSQKNGPRCTARIGGSI